MKNVGIVVIAIIVFACLISSVGAISEAGYLNRTVYGYTTAGAIGIGSTGARTVLGVEINNIQNYEHVSIMIFNLPKSSFTGIGYTSYFEFLLEDEATGSDIGTGTGALFSASDTTATLHLQFDTWDRSSLSGTRSLRFVGTYPSITFSAGSNSGDTTTGVHLNAVAVDPPQESSAIYFYTEYSNYYEFTDESCPEYGSGRLTVNRLTNPSWVNVSVNSVTVMSEYKTTGNSSLILWENPISLDVGFSDGGHMIEDFELDCPLGYSPVTTTPTPTPTPGESYSCDVDLGLSFNKYVAITPISEYITGTLSISGNAVNNITSIQWMVGPGPGNAMNKYMFGSYTNVSGTWNYVRDDLGIVTTGTTTYSDALTESIRFSDAGNYIIRVAVYTTGGCNEYIEQNIQVNPTSGVNLWIYFYDGYNGGILESVGAAIMNVGRTGNTTFYGNPIPYAANIGDNLSVYATLTGYTPHHLFYTVPVPPSGGTHIDVPFYLFPLELEDIHPGNTTLVVNLKSQSTGNAIQDGIIGASVGGVEIAEGTTNSMGYTVLQIPFHPGDTRLDAYAYGYQNQAKYLTLNNATSYETTIYMSYGVTPTATVTATSTYAPGVTATESPAPTVTTTTWPKLTVMAYNASVGQSAPLSGVNVSIYQGSLTDTGYIGGLLQHASTGADGKTSGMALIANGAYVLKVSKTGYYSGQLRFIMGSADSTRYAAMVPIGPGVTVIPTTSGYNTGPTVDIGTGGDYREMWMEWMREHFGLTDWAAGILIGLIITMIGAVFVGGCLASYGGGSGAGLGALVGGCFGWVAACLTGFIPIWALIVSIAFVGMAFFVWRSGTGGGE